MRHAATFVYSHGVGMFGYTIGFNVLPLLIDKFQSLLGEETVALKTALLVVSIVPVFAFAVRITITSYASLQIG